MPEPLIRYMDEAGQQLSHWKPVRKGLEAKQNLFQERAYPMEQRSSSTDFREILGDVLQKRWRFSARRITWNSHNQDRQEWKAKTMDKNFRNQTEVDNLFPVVLGKASWTNTTGVNGSPHGPRHFERFDFQLLPCHTISTHKSPSDRTSSGEKEVSGTTGQVALELGRNCIGIELNPKYVELANARTNVTFGLPLA